MAVRFYDEKFLAKKLGVEKRYFHRIVKPQILKDFFEILIELNVENPDIGLDENDIIYLADPNHKTVKSTQLTIFDYQIE